MLCFVIQAGVKPCYNMTKKIIWYSLIKFMVSLFKFGRFLPHGPIDNELSLDKTTAWCQQKWQALTWINGDPVHWCKHAASIMKHSHMMTSSNGNIFCVTAICAGIHQSPVNSPHKGQWREALMVSLICAWINSWVNNGEAGDLRRHHGHYDVTVMKYQLTRDYIKFHLKNYVIDIQQRLSIC